MEFLDREIEIASAITGSYDSILVTFSFCVVFLAIYSGLSIGGRAHGLAKTYVRKMWLTWGAIILGTGISAMHAIGMHAYKLPVAVHYDIPLTLLSVIAAIISGGIMLWAVGNSRLPGPRLILGGTLFGLGIILTHYTDMAAMHIDARIVYDLPLFIVSIIVAIPLSTAALFLHYRINNAGDAHVYWYRFASTLVLGLAVSGMHYTAMAATYFFPAEHIAATASVMSHEFASGMSHHLLHASVSVVTALIILLAFLTIIIDSRLTAIAGLKNEMIERDRHTETVRVQNQRMDNILNGMHDIYFAVEHDWRICYANDLARDLFKINDQDILGKILWDIAPEFASFFYKNLTRAMANQDMAMCETYYPPERRWFDVRAIPTGEGLAVYLHDTTENKQLIENLHQSERRFQDFAEMGADWFWEMDEDLRFSHFSGGMHRTMGIVSHDMIGKTRWELSSEDINDSKWIQHKEDLKARRSFHDFQYKFLKSDGSVYYWSISGKPIYDAEDRFMGYRGTGTNITAEVIARQAQEESEKRFKDFADIAADWFWEMDENLRFNYFSGRMYQITGVDPASLLGKTRKELAREKTNDSKWQAHLQDLEAHRAFHDFRYKTQRPDGAILYWSTSGKPIFDVDGSFKGYRGVSADVTAEIEAQQALRQSEERFKDFAETAADWFWEMDENLRFTLVLGKYEKASGVSPKDVIGLSRREIFADRINEPIWIAHLEDLEARRPFANFEFKWFNQIEKKEKILSLSGKPVFNDMGAFIGYRGVGRDVTEAHALTTQLSYQASHDTLTGLVNRRELERRLHRILEAAKKEAAEHALCYLDLDQFKVVNDTCGHVAGDELLRQLGKLLPKCVRQQDTVARLGGDEFGVLLEHCTLEQAQRVAEAMRRMVAEFVFLWQGKTFNVGVSIGLVPITQAKDDFSAVLSAADNACYAAKDLGRNRIHVYYESDAGLARRHGDMQWVTRIHQALEENRFELCFQPIVSVASFSADQFGGWDHYELLLRMRDESGKVVYPGAFLPAAERYNLISKLDKWVVSTAFYWFKRHPAQLKRLALCTINLSGQSLENKEFLSFVTGLLRNGGVPPAKICFEITETAAISDLASAIEFIKIIRELGCLFALDDFGSGLSSFGYLKNLPVDFIKIDGLFVKDIVDNPVNLAMVKSINEIGHVMGKKTIAEFVENDAVLNKLRELGVDFAQGYGICKPQPLELLLQEGMSKNLKSRIAR